MVQRAFPDCSVVKDTQWRMAVAQKTTEIPHTAATPLSTVIRFVSLPCLVRLIMTTCVQSKQRLRNLYYAKEMTAWMNPVRGSAGGSDASQSSGLHSAQQGNVASGWGGAEDDFRMFSCYSSSPCVRLGKKCRYFCLLLKPIFQ